MLDSLDNGFGKWRFGFDILAEDRPDTLTADEPVYIRSPAEDGNTDSRSRNCRDIEVMCELEAATERASILSSAKRSSWDMLPDIREDPPRRNCPAGPRPVPTCLTRFCKTLMPALFMMEQPQSISICLQRAVRSCRSLVTSSRAVLASNMLRSTSSMDLPWVETKAPTNELRFFFRRSHMSLAISNCSSATRRLAL